MVVVVVSSHGLARGQRVLHSSSKSIRRSPKQNIRLCPKSIRNGPLRETAGGAPRWWTRQTPGSRPDPPRRWRHHAGVGPRLFLVLHWSRRPQPTGRSPVIGRVMHADAALIRNTNSSASRALTTSAYARRASRSASAPREPSSPASDFLQGPCQLLEKLCREDEA